MSRTPPGEQAYIAFARQHINIWNGGGAQPPAIGLSSSQLTETETATAAAEAAYSAALAARAASKAATEAKDNALAALKAVIGADIDTIDAFAKATKDPNVWVLAQIPAPQSGSERPAPERPTDLDATLRLNGNVELSFRGNTGGGAQYLVQRQTTTVDNVTSDYEFLGFADEEKKFLDTAVPEGLKSVGYRVAARISTGLQSDWSPTFTLPFGSQGGQSSATAKDKAGSIEPVKAEDQKGAG